MGDQRGGSCVAGGSLRGYYCIILAAKPREDCEQVIHSLRSWWDNWASAVVFWRRSHEKIRRKSFIACLAGGIAGRILASEMREDYEQVGKLNFI